MQARLASFLLQRCVLEVDPRVTRSNSGLHLLLPAETWGFGVWAHIHQKSGKMHLNTGEFSASKGSRPFLMRWGLLRHRTSSWTLVLVLGSVPRSKLLCKQEYVFHMESVI